MMTRTPGLMLKQQAERDAARRLEAINAPDESDTRMTCEPYDPPTSDSRRGRRKTKHIGDDDDGGGSDGDQTNLQTQMDAMLNTESRDNRMDESSLNGGNYYNFDESDDGDDDDDEKDNKRAGDKDAVDDDDDVDVDADADADIAARRRGKGPVSGNSDAPGSDDDDDAAADDNDDDDDEANIQIEESSQSDDDDDDEDTYDQTSVYLQSAKTPSAGMRHVKGITAVGNASSARSSSKASAPCLVVLDPHLFGKSHPTLGHADRTIQRLIIYMQQVFAKNDVSYSSYVKEFKGDKDAMALSLGAMINKHIRSRLPAAVWLPSKADIARVLESAALVMREEEAAEKTAVSTLDDNSDDEEDFDPMTEEERDWVAPEGKVKRTGKWTPTKDKLGRKKRGALDVFTHASAMKRPKRTMSSVLEDDEGGDADEVNAGDGGTNDSDAETSSLAYASALLPNARVANFDESQSQSFSSSSSSSKRPAVTQPPKKIQPDTIDLGASDDEDVKKVAPVAVLSGLKPGASLRKTMIRIPVSAKSITAPVALITAPASKTAAASASSTAAPAEKTKKKAAKQRDPKYKFAAADVDPPGVAPPDDVPPPPAAVAKSVAVDVQKTAKVDSPRTKAATNIFIAGYKFSLGSAWYIVTNYRECIPAIEYTSKYGSQFESLARKDNNMFLYEHGANLTYDHLSTCKRTAPIDDDDDGDDSSSSRYSFFMLRTGYTPINISSATSKKVYFAYYSQLAKKEKTNLTRLAISCFNIQRTKPNIERMIMCSDEYKKKSTKQKSTGPENFVEMMFQEWFGATKPQELRLELAKMVVSFESNMNEMAEKNKGSKSSDFVQKMEDVFSKMTPIGFGLKMVFASQKKYMKEIKRIIADADGDDE